MSKKIYGVGARICTAGLVAYVEQSKNLTMAAGLREAVRGAFTVTKLRKLLGLLHHIVIILVLPSHTMYGLYDGLSSASTKYQRRWKSTSQSYAQQGGD